MKLQLDREAIEAIFACRGEEVKVELQSSIVQEFTRRHLKALATKDVIEPLQRQIRDDIIAKIGLRKYYPTRFELNPALQLDVDKFILEEYHRLIAASAERVIRDIDIDAKMRDVIDSKLDKLIEEKIDNKLMDVVTQLTRK